jgi:demethylmenaquinone methyltransferase/2-methoxy-6-polyprenyl-1,4-benzoquinol methylase
VGNPHEVDERVALVERFFAGTGNTYDFMVNFATLGIDRRWKRRLAALVPADATRVLDLACGTGLSTLAIAHRLPRCQVIGVELRDEYLTIARRKAEEQGVRNVEFVLSRAEDYASADAFDCISSSYLAKYADLGRLIPLCRALLRDGGRLIVHDFTFPPNRALVQIWRVYFALLQGIGSRLFPAWREIYYGLPELIEQSRWPQQLMDALGEDGFQDVRMDYWTAYGSAVITAQK